MMNEMENFDGKANRNSIRKNETGGVNGSSPN